MYRAGGNISYWCEKQGTPVIAGWRGDRILRGSGDANECGCGEVACNLGADAGRTALWEQHERTGMEPAWNRQSDCMRLCREPDLWMTGTEARNPDDLELLKINPPRNRW